MRFLHARRDIRAITSPRDYEIEFAIEKSGTAVSIHAESDGRIEREPRFPRDVPKRSATARDRGNSG